jgi:cell division protein ZapA
MDNKKQSIRVNIADRYYPLKVEADDEEKIRDAAKQINEKIALYKGMYADKDMQDFLAMAALQFVTKMIEIDQKVSNSTITEDIKMLTAELDDYLKEEKKERS